MKILSSFIHSHVVPDEADTHTLQATILNLQQSLIFSTHLFPLSFLSVFMTLSLKKRKKRKRRYF